MTKRPVAGRAKKKTRAPRAAWQAQPLGRAPATGEAQLAAERKSARTKRRILDAARDVFAERGYVRATIDDVVQRADVARGTFYLYFDDRPAVFEALVDDLFARIAACIRSIDVAHPTETPVAQLRANLTRLVTLATSDAATMKLLLLDARGLEPAIEKKLDAFDGALHTFLDETLEIGQRIGLVRAGDRRAMVSIGLGGLKELLLDAARGHVTSDAEALVEELMRFLGSGLLAPAPSRGNARR